MICADLIGQRSRLSPDRTALVQVDDGRRFTYRELDHRAGACARTWLYGLGLKPGDRIGILARNRVEYVDAFFAAAKCGVILVPLAIRLSIETLASIVADCKLSALLYGAEFADTVRELRSRVDIGRQVALDSEEVVDELFYGELIASLPEGDYVPSVCKPEDPLCLLYTMGTTGRPKGVITPHRQVAWNAYNTVACWQLSENDCSPVITQMSHAGGLCAFLAPLLLAGGTIILHKKFKPSEVWRTIEEERCTVILTVPVLLKKLVDAPEFKSVNLDHVRWFISGGAPLPRHLIDVFHRRGVVLRQGYGLTEIGVNCFSMSDEEAWSKAGSIGRPVMFTEARICSENREELPMNEIGELCFRGPHVSAGYWNDSAATAEAVDTEGWFYTGDMARRDDEGFFYIAGRAKDMYVSGGVNVYPAEIENVLLQNPNLLEAAVIGVPHPTWGEVGVAFLVAAPERSIDLEELSEFLGKRLARYKIPKEFRIIDELPRNRYGRVKNEDLVKKWEAEGEREDSKVKSEK